MPPHPNCLLLPKSTATNTTHPLSYPIQISTPKSHPHPQESHPHCGGESLKNPRDWVPPQPPPREGKITPTVGVTRGGDLSPSHHFPVRVIFGVLGVITPTPGVDVHPYFKGFLMFKVLKIFRLRRGNVWVLRSLRKLLRSLRSGYPPPPTPSYSTPVPRV